MRRERKTTLVTHSLAWSLAAYLTLTTAVSVSVFTVGEGGGGGGTKKEIKSKFTKCES